jgi:ABC-type sugar transport system ATPase subunit
MSISLDSVYKNYGDASAVRDLNLTCETGQMLGLLGPSGCGKSTALKMIAGIEEITSGSIHFGDRDVSDLPPGARDIAMVFEDYALYTHLTVFENIAFPLRVQGVRRAEVTARVNAMIDLLDLHDIRNDKVRTLSGGAQQRVSIGRALVRKPQVILFDEPLSHLDADQKVHLRTEIKRLQQTQGLTSILVTHDQTEAIAMSDLIAVMDFGVLQQVGAPQDIYETPANTFVATFIGDPPMNLLPAHVSHGGAGVRLEGAGWSMMLSEATVSRHGARDLSEVCVGVRAEHIEQIELGAPHPPTTAVVTGTVYFREHRGDTDILLVACGPQIATTGDHISAEVPGPCPLREGAPVSLAFCDDRISLFDAVTGRNLAL